MEKKQTMPTLKARGFLQFSLTAAVGPILHMHIEALRSQMKFGLSWCSAEGLI